MFKDKKTLRLVVSFIIIFIIIGFALYYFISKQKINNNPTPVENVPLTEEKKVEILNRLNEQPKGKEMTITQKEKILKDLNKSSAKVKPLTEAEKIKLLEGLNKR